MPKDIMQHIEDDNCDLLLVDTGTYLEPALDIVFGESTQPHVRDVCITHPGENKQSPAAGVGMSDYLDDDTEDDLRIKIHREVTADGADIKALQIDFRAKIFNINADY